jgi:hypothetical protein
MGSAIAAAHMQDTASFVVRQYVASYSIYGGMHCDLATVEAGAWHHVVRATFEFGHIEIQRAIPAEE